MCVTAVLHLGVPVGNSIDRQWGTFLGGEVWATRARHFSLGGDEDFRSVLARGGPGKLHKVGSLPAWRNLSVARYKKHMAKTGIEPGLRGQKCHVLPLDHRIIR